MNGFRPGFARGGQPSPLTPGGFLLESGPFRAEGPPQELNETGEAWHPVPRAPAPEEWRVPRLAARDSYLNYALEKKCRRFNSLFAEGDRARSGRRSRPTSCRVRKSAVCVFVCPR